MSGIDAADARTLLESIRGAGYSPAQAQLIVLKGPDSAREAFSVLTNRYCREIAHAGFADIGISHEGRAWRIVLARPLLPPDLGDWRQAGKQILVLTNAARAEARSCGEQRFEPAPALVWNPKLAQAALAHSSDMARHRYFAHADEGGARADDRADRQGYDWRRIGENIATGQGSPRQVVSAWIASPHHCVNLMEPRFTEMGAAYALNPKSETQIYWTQVFATPRAAGG